MTASKRVSPRSLGSDLAKVATHVIQPEEYDELPELISIRLPEDVILKWRATGPGWQTRMAEKLARVVPR